jgi:EamA-like transporter family
VGGVGSVQYLGPLGSDQLGPPEVDVGRGVEADPGVAVVVVDPAEEPGAEGVDVLNYRLIQDEGPTAASMTNYLAPVVAVLLGVAFVDERLSWNLVVGTAVVLRGVWIAEHNPNERGAAASDTLVPSEDGEAQVGERIR